MNLKLTEEQAQAVINSQEAKLGKLNMRLKRAHVTMKYLTRVTRTLSIAEIEKVIKHLEGLMDSDSRQAEETGYSDLNHTAVLERQDEYKALLELEDTKRWEKAKVPMLGYLYQYATNGYDDMAARNVEFEVNELMEKYLWRKGEPETPDFFSSHGLTME